jgi:hypothetical protein
MKYKYLFFGGFLLGLALILAACSGGVAPAEVDTPTPCPTMEPCPECPAAPTAEPCPAPVVQDVPYESQWVNSPHADSQAEAFNHWNEDDPAQVPTNCAKCHSTPGYLDFLGEDGTPYGSVENAAPIGTVITCAACHNDTARAMDSVVFPSGLEVTGLGAQARCMQCHQGRASTVDVNTAIEEAGLSDSPDQTSEDLGFVNIHYFAAAATRLGTEAKGGFEYEGKAYDPRFDHVENFDTCIGCHNQHTLEVRVDDCATCHTDVAAVDDLKDVRMQGSMVDYDGDGNLEEGIYYEIEGLQDMLLQAIQAYGAEVAGAPITYDAQSYPYFFADANQNGQVDDGEQGYNAWTPRLLKAAYNYQTSIKDPGAFAHGGKYIIQLLYDSTEDLNGAISEPVDLSQAHRNDPGHFAASEEAWRHWDEDDPPMVPGSCSKCHSAAGLPLYIQEGVSISQDVASGLNCATCHNDLTTFTRYEDIEVTFPSGATVAFQNTDANLCLNCHQGRESTVSVNQAIARADVEDDVVSDALSFRNPHYFAAGATLFGSEVEGAYQYDGKEYAGRNQHVDPLSNCVQCHDTHALTVQVEDCSVCHAGVENIEDLQDIRMEETPVDYDGDGNTDEGIAGEIDTMEQGLLAAIQAYASSTAGTPIVYDAASYPYFFADNNGNGDVDAEDGAYQSWTPRLLRTTYNYQWVAKDPGAFAHNGDYILQILYDSLEDLGSAEGMIRP